VRGHSDPNSRDKLAISQDFSTGLASGAVVCLVIGAANTENLFATSRARLTVAAVDCHAFVKCSDFFRKASAGFDLQAIHPLLKRVTRAIEQPLPLIRPEFVG
jgi:hypothetical protein